MNIVKITNLFQSNGMCDYKGLDLDLIQAGTQIYPNGSNQAYFYYDGDVSTNGDIEVIDEATYTTIKQSEENKTNQPTYEERLSSVEAAITNLMGV